MSFIRFPKHDEGHWYIGGFFRICYATYRDLMNFCMPKKYLFELGRCDLKASATLANRVNGPLDVQHPPLVFEYVLQSMHDYNRSVIVDIAQVAGPVPTLG